MDQTLNELLTAAADKESGRDECVGFDIEVVDPASGEIEVDLPEGPKRYVLKPLPELFGKDRPPPGEDWQDDKRIMVLLMSIEYGILRIFEMDPNLTDGEVVRILSRLALKPNCEAGDDASCGCIQMHLRLSLSLHDYSRQEVRWALHKIQRSVELHRSLDGPQGYLTFIADQLGDD